MESTGLVNLPIRKEYVLFLPCCSHRTESPLCFLESEMSYMENKCLEESSGSSLSLWGMWCIESQTMAQVQAWWRNETVSQRVFQPHLCISMGLASYLRNVESNKIILKQLIGATERERDKRKIIVKISRSYSKLFRLLSCLSSLSTMSTYQYS